MTKTYAIILASGSGERFGSSTPKQFLRIGGRRILEHTLDLFEASPHIDEIILVVSQKHRLYTEEILRENNYKKVSRLLNGGASRKESSSVGVSSIDNSNPQAKVIIHDCVRPFLSQTIIQNCVTALDTYDAIDVAIPSSDTLIEVNAQNEISTIPTRAAMRRGQTPQAFKLSTIRKAHELSKDDDSFTDDCGLILKHKLAKIFVVAGDEKNIKITHPEDIFIADKLFQLQKTVISEKTDLSVLKDKVIVIFGGNTGIGEAIYTQAKNLGAKAYAFSRQNNCDVSRFEDVKNTLEKVHNTEGKINYVINTAGMLRVGKLLTREIEDIYQEIAINYLSAVHIVKAALPYLKKGDGLLFFASSSYTKGRALYSIYSSSKAALVNLTQALSEELLQEKINVNIINPSRTATPMRLSAFGKEPEEALLSSDYVATLSLHALVSNLTGQVFDIRK